MPSPEFVRATLVNRTNADCSDHEVKHNRYHYRLRFDEDIGKDWLETQIKKAARQVEVALEWWKIRPSGVADFEIEVREVDRREGIDDQQNSLEDFGQ